MIRQHCAARGVLGLLIAGALTLAGCTGTTDDTKPVNGERAQNASAALAQAAQRLQSNTFKMTMTMTLAGGNKGQLSGVMDPKKKTGAFTSTFTYDGTPTTSEWRVIGRTVYLKTSTSKAGLPGKNRKEWQRINPGTDTISDDFDGAQMAKTLQRAATVKRAGDNAFTGTIDVTVAADAIGTAALKPSANSSSAAPQLITFQAGVDGQGRLVRYSLELPNPKGGITKVAIIYSDFGTPVNVQPPPADQLRSKAFP